MLKRLLFLDNPENSRRRNKFKIIQSAVWACGRGFQAAKSLFHEQGEEDLEQAYKETQRCADDLDKTEFFGKDLV